jgi:four helix bundle protein
MRDPQSLTVIERATELALMVYQLTNRLPVEERFGLSAQMRRAAVSVGSNIAEGCGRAGNREFLYFLYVARGSATELAFQLALAVSLGYLAPAECADARDTTDHVQRMLNRLTSSVRRKGTLARARRTAAPTARGAPTLDS